MLAEQLVQRVVGIGYLLTVGIGNFGNISRGVVCIANGFALVDIMLVRR